MEQNIFLIAKQFADECHRLNSRKGGADMTIELSVNVSERYKSEEKTTVMITARFWDGTRHQQCEAASLGTLMDEVYRRAQFEDREATRRAAVEADLVALPAPSDAQ